MGGRADRRLGQQAGRGDHRPDAAPEPEQEITFAIVTHDIGIGRRADRIVRMADGQIVGEEYPA
jgi:ABC-type Fe3+/spermidine/putrescine transport system ATPase subunit